MALLVAVASTPACVPLCSERPPVECQHAGSVYVASPTYALPATVEAAQGSSCLAWADGTCSAPPTFMFQSAGDRSDGHRIFVAFELSASDGPKTYQLTDDDTTSLRIDGGIRNGEYSSGFKVMSGTLTVSRSDTESLQASFEMEVETLDGQHDISLTGGWIDVSGCYLGDAVQKPCTNS